MALNSQISIGPTKTYARDLTLEAIVWQGHIAYVPRATANDRGSWSLSRVFDTATIGSARLFPPQQPQSNADTWIRPRSEKSLALLVALLLSLFVFVIAAGEAGAEEQVALPTTKLCATPPGTVPPGTVPPGTALCPSTARPSAVDTLPVGSKANEMPPARPFLSPLDSMPPAPGSEEGIGQHPLPKPGADVGGPVPEPISPPQSPSPEAASTPFERHGPATSPIDQPRTKTTPEQDLPMPRSAPDPGPLAMESYVAPTRPSTPKKDEPAGAQPSTAPSKKAPAYPILTIESARKPAPSVADRTADQQMSSRARESGGAGSAVRQVAEPLVQQAPTLPSFTVESHVAVHETLTRTLKAISDTVARDLVGIVESWTADWLPFDDATQSPLEGTVLEPLDPLFPTMPPLEDSSFFSLTGVGQVGPGGGLGLLLLGVLVSVLILLRQEGPLSWISGESPKPTSALLMPLERPG